MIPQFSAIGRRTVVHNGLLNMLEYAAQPALLLLAAPILLRKWGLAEYGVWMLITATISAVANLAAGFADSTVKYVSTYRGTGERERMTGVLRATLLINLALGTVLATAVWTFAPAMVRAVHLDIGLSSSAILALRIASPILLLRSMESVLLASIRAFERYAPAVVLSTTLRVTTCASTITVAVTSHGIVAATASTLALVIVGTLAEFVVVRRIVGPLNPKRLVTSGELSEVVNFASFGGLQGFAGLLFNHADRWAIGAMLGASAVAYYSVCVQIAQPVHALISAGLNVIFPHLSAKTATTPAAHLHRLVSRILRLNLCLAVLVASLVGLSAMPFMSWLLGADFSQRAWPPLAILIIAFALLAGNITGHFTLLAFGDAGYVCAVNLSAAALSFALLFALAPPFGLVGASISRLAYGPVTWLVYARLRQRLAARESLTPALTHPHPGTISDAGQVAL